MGRLAAPPCMHKRLKPTWCCDCFTAKVVEMICYKHVGMSDVFFEQFWLYVKGRIDSVPFTGSYLEVQVVAAKIPPIVGVSRNLRLKSLVGVVTREVEHFINFHRVKQIVSASLFVKANNPVVRLRLDAHVVRGASNY